MQHPISFQQLAIGDKIAVQGWGGGIRIGYITALEDNIKRGQPGVDFDQIDQAGNVVDRNWCYYHQIVGFERPRRKAA
jgi:hypothetical protein